MNSPPHMKTFRMIHRITADGILTTDEIRDLTQFLNENREAPNSWPGDIPWHTLESVFDDGLVDENEMEALGTNILDIRTQIAAMNKPSLKSYIRVRSRKERYEGSASENRIAYGTLSDQANGNMAAKSIGGYSTIVFHCARNGIPDWFKGFHNGSSPVNRLCCRYAASGSPNMLKSSNVNASEPGKNPETQNQKQRQCETEPAK